MFLFLHDRNGAIVAVDPNAVAFVGYCLETRDEPPEPEPPPMPDPNNLDRGTMPIPLNQPTNIARVVLFMAGGMEIPLRYTCEIEALGAEDTSAVTRIANAIATGVAKLMAGVRADAERSPIIVPGRMGIS